MIMKRMLSLWLLSTPLVVSACNSTAEATEPKAEVVETTEKIDSQQPHPIENESAMVKEKVSPKKNVPDPMADPCETICLRSKELNCKLQGEVCKAACIESRDVPVCFNEMAEVMGCVVKEPVANWECSDEDIAAVKDGYCQTEQERFIRCLAAFMK